jgi:hypothetical protein
MQPRLWNDLKTTLAGELGCESNLTAIRLSSALGTDQTFNPRQRSIYKVVLNCFGMLVEYSSGKRGPRGFHTLFLWPKRNINAPQSCFLIKDINFKKSSHYGQNIIFTGHSWS